MKLVLEERLRRRLFKKKLEFVSYSVNSVFFRMFILLPFLASWFFFFLQPNFFFDFFLLNFIFIIRPIKRIKFNSGRETAAQRRSLDAKIRAFAWSVFETSFKGSEPLPLLAHCMF